MDGKSGMVRAMVVKENDGQVSENQCFSIAS